MINERKAVTTSTILGDVISKLDVNAVGIASLAEWKGTKLEETALRLLPQACSVLVFAMEIYPEILDLVSPERIMGAASTNDLLDRHADFLSGRLTKAAYDVAIANGVAPAVLDQHASKADLVPWLLLVLAVLRVGGVRKLGRPAQIGAIAGGIALAIFVIVVGNSGGTLVFEHGVGVAK